MLREKDPRAMELYARHQQVTMPSIQVSEKDVAELMSYIESRSRAAAARAREAAARR